VPIYEYLCESCETLTERIQKVGDRAPRRCPECGSSKIAKLVSRTSFQLKGGGWYSDLYASPRQGGERKGTHAPRPETGRDEPAGKPEEPTSQPASPKKGKKG
jgi:putative FmdB family regulatory protein